jgi:hypothetical protein
MKVRVVGFVPRENEIMYSGYGKTEFGIAQEVNDEPKAQGLNDKLTEPDGSVV